MWKAVMCLSLLSWVSSVVYACILCNISLSLSGALGIDAGLPSALGRIIIMVSEVGYEPLVVGPSAEPWTLSLDVSNFPVTLSVRKLGLSGWGGTMDREEDRSYMLVFSCRS